MFFVGPEELPNAEFVSEAVELMLDAFAVTKDSSYIDSLHFVGEVYRETPDDDRFLIIAYSGRITGLVIKKPPRFNLLVDEAAYQVAECDCPSPDLDLLFESPEQAMEEAKISEDCDEFAGAPAQDPHYEVMELEPNTEVTIRFDRLGEYGVVGMPS